MVDGGEFFGLFAEGDGGALAFSYVAEDGKVTARQDVCSRIVFEITNLTVGAIETEKTFLLAGLQKRAPRLRQFKLVARLDEASQVARQQLVSGHAKQFAGRRVCINVVAVIIGNQHGFEGIVEDGAKWLIVIKQRRARLLVRR